MSGIIRFSHTLWGALAATQVFASCKLTRFQIYTEKESVEVVDGTKPSQPFCLCLEGRASLLRPFFPNFCPSFISSSNSPRSIQQGHRKYHQESCRVSASQRVSWFLLFEVTISDAFQVRCRLAKASYERQ